ncbi:MAG: class I SAM-dependent methyltransferase [Terriglobales bacterium]
MPLAASPEDLQRHERACRERVLSYRATRRTRYEWRVEREAVMARLRPHSGLRVLDAGCGIGRISLAALGAGAEVVAVDFAFARLRQLRQQAPAWARLRVCQADLTRLPVRAAQFEAIVCTQVLEHLPGAAGRRALLAAFARLLLPGGRLLLTVYNHSCAWRRRGLPREGVHESGIFYHCYEADELRSELADFEVLELCGVSNLLPHTWRLFPLLGPLGRFLDHRAEGNPAVSQDCGQLLLAHARLRAEGATRANGG